MTHQKMEHIYTLVLSYPSKQFNLTQPNLTLYTLFLN